MKQAETINLQEIRDFYDTNPQITNIINTSYISISPLSTSHKKIEVNDNIKLIRCFKCSAYANPYCEFIRNSFKCSICLSVNFTDLQLNLEREKYNRIFDLSRNYEENKELIKREELINKVIETEADDKFVFKKPTKNLVSFIFEIENVALFSCALKNILEAENSDFLKNKMFCFSFYEKGAVYFLKNSFNNSLLILKDLANPPLIQKSQIYFNLNDLMRINVEEIIQKVLQIKKYGTNNEENNIFVALTILCKYLTNSSIYCFPFSDSNFFKNVIEENLEENSSTVNFILSTNNPFSKSISHLSTFSFKTGGTLLLYDSNSETDTFNTFKRIMRNIKETVNNVYLRIRCSAPFQLHETFFKRIDKQNNLICINNLKTSEFIDFSIKKEKENKVQLNDESCVQIALLYDHNSEKKLRIINLLVSHKNTSYGNFNTSLHNKLTGSEIFHLGSFYFLKKYTEFIKSLNMKDSKAATPFLSEFPKNMELLYLIKCIDKNLLFKPTNLLFKYFYYHRIISEGVYFKSRLFFPILIYNDEIQPPHAFDESIKEFILICGDKIFIKIEKEEMLEDKIIEISEEFQLNDLKVIINDNIEFTVVKSYLVS